MPDESGFVYGMTGGFGAYANLFHFDLASGWATPITDLTDAFASDPSVSPDGRWVCYTKHRENALPEVWVARLDGRDTWRVAMDAAFPAWGPSR